MIDWIKRKLGIELLERKVQRLYKLEWYTLADVVDRLSESMIVLTSEGQKLNNAYITVPHTKSGILVLGKDTIVNGCIIRGEQIRTTTITEPIDNSTETKKGEEDE